MMRICRRDSIRFLTSGAGALAAGHLWPGVSEASETSEPKRVIFFLQNHGLNSRACIPDGAGGSLASRKLPEPLAPLRNYKERMHIIEGLHGLHTSPSHSAYFGALGGYRGGAGVAPSAATIDHVLSRTLPDTPLPHLCIGMDSTEEMFARPTLTNLSASGARQPIFMHSNPNLLYQMLFGVTSKGDVRKAFDARSNMFEQLEKMAALEGSTLSSAEIDRYDRYRQGFRDINGLQERLLSASDHLRRFAPPIDDRYTRPKFETDWHDALLDLGIAALKSGITNTLTIASGRGHVGGSWFGLDVQVRGHSLGHLKLEGGGASPVEIWTKIYQYNCRMLVRIMQELETVPEGSGTMMDNTLIVYTSNNGEKQHTNGDKWPVVLLGNFDGRIKTGQFTQLNDKRPINALYATILQATTGKPFERFNLSDKMADQYDAGNGPVRELLA